MGPPQLLSVPYRAGDLSAELSKMARHSLGSAADNRSTNFGAAIGSKWGPTSSGIGWVQPSRCRLLEPADRDMTSTAANATRMSPRDAHTIRDIRACGRPAGFNLSPRLPQAQALRPTARSSSSTACSVASSSCRRPSHSALRSHRAAIGMTTKDVAAVLRPTQRKSATDQAPT